MKVNTFIVGAPKAGTTSLHYYLQQHPDVCMSEIKEPNYFTAQEVVKLYYDVSPVNSEDWYHSIFTKPTRKVIGEGSPKNTNKRQKANQMPPFQPRLSPAQ